MKEIEQEIDENGGIYPLNAGRLSQAELCRRAGVANVTLQNPAHRTSTLRDVNRWLNDIKSKSVKGSKSVRRSITARVDEWKSEFQKVATKYNISQLKVADLRVELEDSRRQLVAAQELIASLEGEVSALRIDLAAGKVVRLTSSKK